MGTIITKKERKKVKTTCVIFAVLFLISTIITLLFANAIPKTNEVKHIGEEGETIQHLIEGADGSEYHILTDRTMYRFNSFTDELISSFNLAQVERKLRDKGDYNKLINGSLVYWSATYLQGENNGYYILSDGNGNLFKLSEQNGSLIVEDDYYLVSSKTSLKGSDNVGNDLYLLALESDNSFNVHKLDITNLAGGVVKKKLVWDLDLTGESASEKKLIPMSANSGILSFHATSDYLYIFKDGGGIVKISNELCDFIDENGNELNYFNVADDYYTEGYKQVYQESYTQELKTAILGLEQTIFTQDQINSATSETLEEYLVTLRDSEVINDRRYSRILSDAKSSANYASENSFVDLYPWCVAYNKATKSITVNTEYLNDEFYSVLYSGESTISGIQYSKKNQAVYYADASDGYLYSIKKSDIDSLKNGEFIADHSTKIQSVTFGGDKKFSTFGNGLGFNKFANTLYVKFENERIVSIVDINDASNPTLLYTFEADFDIYGFTGDQNNKVLHAIHKVSIVDLKGNTTAPQYVCTYYPEQFEDKALIKAFFIAFLVLSVIFLLFTLRFLKALKSNKSLEKLKLIARDTKKNKFVYLALLPFVAMLIAFCYYEAVGAISMSFFNYTREKPAWIWNNFGNYLKILNQPNFWPSVLNMLFFLVFDLFLCIVPPLIFAYLLILIRNKKFSGLVRSLMFIPSIIPSMATMLIWRTGIYGADGVFNQILAFLGQEPVEFLMDANYSRWSLIFMGFPFVGGYLIFYGGMMNVPKEYHEAGRLEGLGVVKRFLLIDIPLIAPQIKYIFIMTFISSVQNYARTYILGSSGTLTPVESMYRIMTGAQADYGMASAYATLIFLFLFAAVATNFKMQRKDALGEDL